MMPRMLRRGRPPRRNTDRTHTINSSRRSRYPLEMDQSAYVVAEVHHPDLEPRPCHADGAHDLAAHRVLLVADPWRSTHRAAAADRQNPSDPWPHRAPRPVSDALTESDLQDEHQALFFEVPINRAISLKTIGLRTKTLWFNENRSPRPLIPIDSRPSTYTGPPPTRFPSTRMPASIRSTRMN